MSSKDIISTLQGRFTLVAKLKALPGKGDEVEKLLAAVAADANSAKEEGTLTYRVNRGWGVDAEKFVVFEEYENPAAIGVHGKGEAYNKLVTAGVLDMEKFDVEIYREFTPGKANL